ncbi:MAG TPA: hypothetical protein VF725_08630 [Ktedonobacterales bacterium]
MISCQRCAAPLAPNMPACPRCGAPNPAAAGWGQPGPGAMGGASAGMPGAPYGDPYGGAAFAHGGYGDPGQPPRFSAGSLIDDDGLPAWLSAPDGPAAQQGRAPQAPAQPAPAPNPPWQQRTDSHQQDVAAQRTVRQPTVGPASPQHPFAQPPYQQPPYQQPPYQQPPYQQPPYQQPQYQQPQRQQPAPPPYQQPSAAPPPYQRQPAPPPYPAPLSYPPQPGYGAPQPAPYPQQPQPANYPLQPNYGGNPAYQQPPHYQQPPAPTNVNAFPSIDQAGVGYSAPQPGGVNNYAQVNPQALPHWLTGGQPGVVAAPRAPVPSGMQARSLVDDRALPKWLRDQPESAGAANVSEWIGASAAQEPLPQVLSQAYAQAPSAHAPQPFAAPAHAEEPPAGAGFSASDLIDPNSLPDWVTQRAPAPQTFSSTQGWSSAAPETPDMETVMRTPAQGFGASYDDATGGALAEGAEMGWGDDVWEDDATLAPDHTGYGPAADHTGYGPAADADYGDAADRTGYGAAARAPRGRPLDPNELPPWLQNQGGGQPSSGHNPWIAPSQPEGYGGGWDDGEGWDNASSQQPAAGWDDESREWDARPDDRRNDRRGYHDAGDGYSEQRAAAPRWDESNQGYSEQYPAERRDHQQWDYDQRGGDGRGNDQRGGGRRGYDQRGYDDGYENDEMDYDESDDDDDGRGRGFLGFLRRGRR